MRLKEPLTWVSMQLLEWPTVYDAQPTVNLLICSLQPARQMSVHESAFWRRLHQMSIREWQLESVNIGRFMVTII